MSDIVELLRTELRRSGVSAARIARQTGLHYATVARLMDGEIDRLTSWLGKRVELHEGPRYDTAASVTAKLRVIPRMAVWLRQ